MDDLKKTELWRQLVSKHTASAKAQAEAAGNVAKEAAPVADAPPPTAPAPPVVPVASAASAASPGEGDQLVAAIEDRLTKRIEELEAKLGDIGKGFEAAIAKATELADAAVAKAASDQAVAKAELDKALADTKTLVDEAKAAAKRIEDLAPRGAGQRGAGQRIDDISKSKTPPAEKTEAELLAQNAPGVLKMAEGAK